MALRDDLLPVLNAVRALPGALGVRQIAVKVRAEARSAAYGIAGGVITPTDTTITPTPKVRKLSQEDASFYGSGKIDAATGQLGLAIWEVGPLTPSHATGGYKLSDLVPAPATDAARPLIVLVDAPGTEIGTETLCEVVDVDDSRPFRVMLRVQQAARLT